MAKVKYQRGSDGFFRTKIWDGTYNKDGSKHRVGLSSRKSSGDLEKQVNLLREKVRNGQVVQTSDVTFCQYAREWRNTYKGIREDNTRATYDNIIENHIRRVAQLIGDTEAVVMKVYNHVQEHRENVEKAVNDAVAL